LERPVVFFAVRPVVLFAAELVDVARFAVPDLARPAVAGLARPVAALPRVDDAALPPRVDAAALRPPFAADAFDGALRAVPLRGAFPAAVRLVPRAVVPAVLRLPVAALARAGLAAAVVPRRGAARRRFGFSSCGSVAASGSSAAGICSVSSLID
jgi:hypothetical protein